MNAVTKLASLAVVVLSFGGLVAACAGNGNDSCDPVCVDFTTCCNGACVSTIDDEANCGGCGIACAAGQYCESNSCMGTPSGDAGMRDSGGGGGTCRPECSASQRCCGSTCVGRSVAPSSDGRSDGSFQNCNGCGIACDTMRASSCSVPGGGEGMPRCLCGDFDQCRADEVCVSETGTWLCVSTSTDPNNCGSVGHACAMGESCSGGTCVCGSSGGACSGGQACCAGTCLDVSADAMNCGACGTACGTNAPNCVSGECRCGTATACRMPTAGMFPAPSDIGESCCDGACRANTSTNCGCGVDCTAAGDTCIVSGGSIIPGGPTGAAGVCCGTEIPFIGGTCTGGFPGLGDGGLPFP